VVADWLARVEARLAEGAEETLAEALAGLAYAAAAQLAIPDSERHGAGRRALLLLAAGGDPSRRLDIDGRAVRAVASELGTPERLAGLEAGLADLREEAVGLPHVAEVLRGLTETPDVAWRAYAAAVLAEELEAEIGED
jgi:hypothetical protein